jgi:hypothetical protein
MSIRPVVHGSLGFLKTNNPDDDLKFQFNPQTVTRSRAATYAHSMAALADFPNASENAIPSIEWNRNEAEEISFDLFLNRQGNEGANSGRGNGPAHVETELLKLDALMKPDQNTGRPRDLVLKMGPRADRVRIINKVVIEKLYDPDLYVQQATVALRLIALRSRSK